MKIDSALIDRLAELSKLEFNETEKDAIREDLQKMLNFINKLNEVETQGYEPLIFMTDELNQYREDVAEHTITKEEALKNAPKKDSDYFKVPKVIGGNNDA
jgi:aspartyl-tRNA(Asn)/glutamyl-tRNA(Gln) amidotransferase subunit C